MDFLNLVIYISVYIGLVATSFYALSYFSGSKKEKPLYADNELPTVSVLIPMYNEEKSIKRTLESVLSSEYPKGKMEIIVIDNNSKDNSLKIAKKFTGIHNNIKVRVLQEKTQGKGYALNKGIRESKSQIVLSMDADTFIEPHSLKEMMRFFKNPQVMCVSPAMVIEKPRTILQRIQQAEYLFGLFLRKAFSSINAVHITPGAFSAYRRSFFEKHGYYDEHNITEDLELALRIQSKGYIIENCPESPAYTIAPHKFRALLVQRRRWYTGLMRNTWSYRRMILNPEYGDLGMFVMPIAWISIFFAVFVLLSTVFRTLIQIKDELVFLSNVNFDFKNVFDLNLYIIERFFFLLFSNPIIIFIIFFIAILGVYLKYATKKVGRVSGLKITLPLFFLLFSILFAFWWIISIIYVAFNRKVKWR